MDRAALITARPYDVRIFANGRDVSDRSPIVAVRYAPDGTGTRTLRDGSELHARWRFLDPGQTQVEVEGPEGVSRWVIVELDAQRYRKVDIATGVEFVHRPRSAA